MPPSPRPETPLPPYYQSMSDCRRRSMQCAFISRKSLLIVNCSLACLFVFGLALLMFTDFFSIHQAHMTMYCKRSDYNVSNTTQPFGSFEYFIISLTAAPCFLMMASKYYEEERNTKKALLTFLLDFCIVLIHLAFLAILITTFKLCFGIPRPSLFGDEQLRKHYCDPLWYNTPLPMDLQATDYHMRTSFPSFRSSLYMFVLTFVYLYIDRIDSQTGIHSTQQVVIIVLGSQVCNKMIALWENGDSHLADILIGAAIGVIYGAITIRNIFGTVFRSSISFPV